MMSWPKSVLLLVLLSMVYRSFGVSVRRPVTFRSGNSQLNSRKEKSATNQYGRNWFTPFGFGNKQSNEIKVISDVDDTIVSSGGIKLFGVPLGGIDNQYKRGYFYPGVLQFALELSRSMNNNGYINNKGKISPAIPSKIAVLTARAREFKFALELKASGKLCSAYSKLGKRLGYSDWGIGDVYYGSVKEWIFSHKKGLRKFMNFEIMMQNDDTISGATNAKKKNYILVGDTGERDEECGERMATHYPQRMSAVFLHKVGDIKRNNFEIKLPADRKVNNVPFFYFRTYVGAAVKAHKHQLMSKEGVVRVAQQAVEDLHNYDIQLSKKKNILTVLQRKQLATLQRSRWTELLNDVNECTFLSNVVKEIPASALLVDDNEANDYRLQMRERLASFAQRITMKNIPLSERLKV